MQLVLRCVQWMSLLSFRVAEPASAQWHSLCCCCNEHSPASGAWLAGAHNSLPARAEVKLAPLR